VPLLDSCLAARKRGTSCNALIRRQRAANDLAGMIAELRHGLRGCTAAAAAGVGAETAATRSGLVPPMAPLDWGMRFASVACYANWVKAPPGGAGIAVPRRLGRDVVVRALSATEECHGPADLQTMLQGGRP
jgi:hypothetical protein